MNWRESYKADPVARRIADRHYNRQKHGAPQFVPPGRALVLLVPPSDAGQALWISSNPLAEYVRHAWAGAWMCTAFRNETSERGSLLIDAAVAATRAAWGDPPQLGFVTFVDPSKVRHKRDPGRCFMRARWRRVGQTAGGLLAFQLAPEDFPPPAPAERVQMAFGWQMSNGASVRNADDSGHRHR